MATYGLKADQEINAGSQLYIPGQTKLAKGDVFLGGTAVLNDADLGQATRVAGLDRQGTASAYSAYQAGQNSLPKVPAQPQVDISAQLQQLKKAQLSASMASLDKQKNASLSNLSAERATIEPAYQKEKMQAGVTAKQASRSFGEYMAQRGGGAGASGIGGQGELMNNMAFQRQTGELGQAETSALSDNARRVTDLNNAYEGDKVGVAAGIEAQGLERFINQMNLDRNFNYTQSRDAVGDSRYNTETAYNQSRDAVGDNRYNAATAYSQGRDAIGDTRYGTETAYGQSRDAIGDTRYADETAYARNQDTLNRVLESQKFAASQAKASSSGSSSKKGSTGGNYSDSATNSMLTQLKGALSQGATVSDMLEDLDVMEQDGTANLRNFDTEYLRNWVNSQRLSISDLRRSQGGGI